jgi:hypothetical protein
MAGSGTTVASGSLLISTNTGKTLDGRIVKNIGTATWSGGSLWAYNGAVLHNTASGTLDLSAGAEFTWCKYISAGTSTRCERTGTQPSFVNDGVMTKLGSSSFTYQENPAANGLLQGSVRVINRGTLRIAAGELKVADYSQTAGALRLEGGNIAASVPLALQGGQFSGTGILTGTIVNTSQVAPGGSTTTGILRIRDKYTQQAGGSFNLDIGGHAPGSQFDQLNITNLATLGGSLTIRLSDGYVPSIGDTFPIVIAGSRSGEFATIVGLEIGAGKRFQVTYSATGVTLQVVATT